MADTILVTGATGFLGSVLCADLSRDHRVIGLYRRHPSPRLKRAAPSVRWVKGEVADRDCLDWAFRQCRDRGTPVTYVIHFAAFTGFGEKWEDEYTDTNVIGTKNIIEAARDAGARRILFAGSIAALNPPAPGEALTEKDAASGEVAYARSKAMGEELLQKNAHRIPAVVLRLGGVFTDFCELPPLFSVIKLWSMPLAGRMMPGKGLSGFPYIHRKDVTALVRRILEKDRNLDRFETLFGAPAGATCQKELFPLIRRACGNNFSTRPVHVPLPAAKMVLHGKYLINTLLGQNTYERAWMIDYADRPLVVDTTHTHRILGWSPTPGLDILARLPKIMANFKAAPRAWTCRNIKRNDQKYEFDPD